MTEGVFPWNIILSQMSHNKSTCQVIFGLGVMTTGSGPCDEDDFDNFLRTCNVQPNYIYDPLSSKLIIGHEGWDAEMIHAAIETRAGGSLWVYSQEMVFASLAIGVDVFNVYSPDELTSFGNGHPALEYLMEDVGFEWPTTQVFNPGGGIFDADMPSIGLLKYKGYTVGKNGLHESARHQILTDIYENQLPYGFSDTYINQWGSPGSSRRLMKIANSLAAFCRNNKSKENPSLYAISDWESDLSWLKANFYIGHFRFQWPSSEIL